MTDKRHENFSEALKAVSTEAEMLDAMSWLFTTSGNGNVDEFLPAVENRTRQFMIRDMLSSAGFLHGLEVFLYFNRLGISRQILRNLERIEINDTTRTLRSLLFGAGDEKRLMLEALYFLKHRQYDEKFLALSDMAEKAIRNLPLASYGAVLDAACGTGLAGPILRDAGFAGKLVGVDISSHMISQAREKTCYDRLVVAGIAEFLADSDDAFDATLMIGVVPHLDPHTLGDIFRLAHDRLKDNGFLLVNAPIVAGDSASLNARFGLHKSSTTRIAQDLDQIGFHITAVDDRTGQTRQFSCRKIPLPA